MKVLAELIHIPNFLSKQIIYLFIYFIGRVQRKAKKGKGKKTHKMLSVC